MNVFIKFLYLLKYGFIGYLLVFCCNKNKNFIARGVGGWYLSQFILLFKFILNWLFSTNHVL